MIDLELQASQEGRSMHMVEAIAYMSKEAADEY
jgi:hypothetical protein